MYRLIFSFFAFFLPFSLFAYYQTQGFVSWNEWDRKTDFVCKESCFVVMDPSKGKFLELSGDITWQGILAYGYLIEGKIQPIETLPLSVSGSYQFGRDIWAHPQYDILSKLPLILVFQWEISGSLSKLAVRNLSFSESIGYKWAEFWNMRPVGPATINLLPGPMISWQSVNGWFYWIFAIGALMGGVVVKRWKKMMNIIILAATLFFVYDIRMSSEFLSNYTRDIALIRSEWDFRDRGDFYRFIEHARTSLEKAQKKPWDEIAFYTDYTWPFGDSARYFLYPYHIVKWSPKDTVIVYRYSNMNFSQSGLVLSGASLWSGMIDSFSPHAFIFSK